MQHNLIDLKTACSVEKGAYELIGEIDKYYKPMYDFDYSMYLYVRMVLSITLDNANPSNNLIIRPADREVAEQSAIFSNAYNSIWARQIELNNLPSVVLQRNEPRILEIAIANFKDDYALGSAFSFGALNVPYVQYFKMKSVNNVFRMYAANGFTIRGKIWGIRA